MVKDNYHWVNIISLNPIVLVGKKKVRLSSHSASCVQLMPCVLIQ